MRKIFEFFKVLQFQKRIGSCRGNYMRKYGKYKFAKLFSHFLCFQVAFFQKILSRYVCILKSLEDISTVNIVWSQHTA